ncbi:MAG: universal stress protein [Halodesulfovibrio sp.]
MLQEVQSSKTAPRADVQDIPSLLIAVGEQPEHLFGVQFISQFFKDFDRMHFRLMHLLPPSHGVAPGPYGLPVEAGRMDEAIYNRHREMGRHSLQLASGMLRQAGIPEGNISLISRPQNQTKALDLIQESAANHHHALVLGNRGRSWFEAMLDGIPDITREVIDASCGIPLWIAPSIVEKRRDILLCVDGSRYAMNMVRHVGETLGSQGTQNVTLLRVLRDRNNNPTPPEVIFEECRNALEEHGVPSDSIRVRVVTDNDPAAGILSVCERGKFAVVAMGRAGYGNSFMRRLLMGSVSRDVMRQLNNACLWLTC